MQSPESVFDLIARPPSTLGEPDTSLPLNDEVGVQDYCHGSTGVLRALRVAFDSVSASIARVIPYQDMALVSHDRVGPEGQRQEQGQQNAPPRKVVRTEARPDTTLGNRIPWPTGERVGCLTQQVRQLVQRNAVGHGDPQTRQLGTAPAPRRRC